MRHLSSSNAILAGLTALLLITLALYCIAGLFAQPLADDLAFITLAKTANPLIDQYYHWQGRYSFSVLNGVILPIAPNLIVRLFPALLISLMVAVLYKLLGRVVTNPLMASSAFVLASLASMPSVWQSVYWYSASSNYVFAILLAMGVLLWLLH